jgi:hypothetical protein
MIKHMLERFDLEELLCAKCGKSVAVGQEIVVKYPPMFPVSPYRQALGKLYHKTPCWESLFY